MADSDRENSYAQVKTDLLAINGTGSYTNTVEKVYRDMRSPEQCEAFPAIIMLEGDEEHERDSSTQRLFLMAGLTLLAYLEPGVEADEISTQINSFAADIKIAMIGSSNRTHGNYCINTYYRGMDPVAVEGTTLAGLIMEFELYYSHTWNTP